MIVPGSFIRWGGQLAQLLLQLIEINRLRDELDSAEFGGTASPLVVAICC
jgi:hypothetical protein